MNDDSIVHRLTSLDGSPLPVAKLTPLVMSPPKKGNTWTCVTWLFLHRIAHRSDYKWQMNRPTVRNRIWQFTAQKRRHRRLPAPLSPVWTNQSCRFVSSSTTYYYLLIIFFFVCLSFRVMILSCNALSTWPYCRSAIGLRCWKRCWNSKWPSLGIATMFLCS